MEKITDKWYNCTIILDTELNSGHKIIYSYLLFTTSNYKLKPYIFCYWISPFKIILFRGCNWGYYNKAKGRVNNYYDKFMEDIGMFSDFDLILTNGYLVDGTGGEQVKNACVTIKDGKIASIIKNE